MQPHHAPPPEDSPIVRAASQLEIPATFTHVRSARILAGRVGASAGLATAAVEGLELAVTEGCSILLDDFVPMPRADGPARDTLSAVFERTDAVIDVRLQRRDAVAIREPSPTARAVLDTMCSRWFVNPLEAEVRLSVEFQPDGIG